MFWGRIIPHGDTAAFSLFLLVAIALLYGVLLFESSEYKEERNRNRLWIATQQWAREHTAAGSVFLVAPQLDNFRTFSSRSEFGSWKDGTLSNFSPAYAREWWTRMQLLGMKDKKEYQGYRALPALQENWQKFSADEIATLMKNHSISYAVSDTRLPTDVQPRQVYENAEFHIYELRELD